MERKGLEGIGKDRTGMDWIGWGGNSPISFSMIILKYCPICNIGMNCKNKEGYTSFLKLLAEAPCFCTDEHVCHNCQLIDKGFKCVGNKFAFAGME